jgi:uncharacterized membrane protein YedE/YeeE
MENFTPVSALIGGGLIGLAAAVLLLFNGRIAGISGIVGDLLRPVGGDWGWRVAFVLGLIAGPLVYQLIAGRILSVTIDAQLPILIVGGFLVGFGTNLGSGCTSGHGVCGIARLSPRSIVATAVFMLAGMITVYVVRHAVS